MNFEIWRDYNSVHVIIGVFSATVYVTDPRVGVSLALDVDVTWHRRYKSFGVAMQLLFVGLDVQVRRRG